MIETSIYIHIPFCVRRCGYCDFNTFAGMDQYIINYVESLCQEIKSVAERTPEKINVGTVFFGGGTPSLLTCSQIETILEVLGRSFLLNHEVEITIEANPGTVDAAYIKDIRSLGVNRISLGMQSGNVNELRILDRKHQHTDVINAVANCRSAGFEHINLDLIYGIPTQTIQSWSNTLDLALCEQVDHLSLYSLTIEKGTKLSRWINRGVLPVPDDDLAADMYELAGEKLTQSGFHQYEISNWSKEIESRCRHNIQYWRYLPYLGFGAGAHGFYIGTRTENQGKVPEYIQLINEQMSNEFPASSACVNILKLSKWEQMQEYLMVGFRLTEEGVSRSEYKEKFGFSLEQFFSTQLHLLLQRQLIEEHPQDEDRLRLTKRGRLLGNRVFAEFIGNEEPPGLNQRT